MTTVETSTTLVTGEQNALVAVPKNSNYIAKVMAFLKESFLAVNEGMELDFVRLGTWVKISKKGNFVESNDETISFGDTWDVVIGHGEQRWMVWGAEKSPEDGQLIVAASTRDEGIEQLTQWLEANPDAVERYGEEDVKIRYLAYLAPVNMINPQDIPSIYLMSFAPTDTYGFGAFAKDVFLGKYKNTFGIPTGTGINRIVMRLITEERSGQGNNSYIGLKFLPVGMFDPADYGVDVDAQFATAASGMAEQEEAAKEATQQNA